MRSACSGALLPGHLNQPAKLISPMSDPTPQAWLEFADGRMHWLDQNICTIGRISPNSLILDSGSVSRNHAMLQPAPTGGYLLTDLRSTNGTYHNGLRIEHVTPLRDGDALEIGGIKFVFRCQQLPDQPAADTGATSVTIHLGLCWLLMLDLVGHTSHTHAVGTEAAADDFKQWLQLVRPVLMRGGGNINAYLGDAVFAYWRADKQPAERVSATLLELARLQAQSPRPYRIVTHYGQTRISGGLQGESLSGTDVIYLFRIEKATKLLGSPCVLSEPAAKSLNLDTVARPLGSHPVRDYPGDHAFFGVG